MNKRKKKQWINIEGRVNLAGVQYGDYQLAKLSLKAGTVLQLVGCPSNKYDSMAISVRVQGVHLGWIPRYSIQQSELWNINRRGIKCIAVLTAYNKTNPTWSMITVQCKRRNVEGIEPKNEITL